ncbi:cation transporter [Heliobacterium gestii]|uniref:Cation transporter n=1 Tax=Heliomicrobium gestii TaxID=2699 RepID=A0A845LAH6_HELGE|nr:cation transporter [Heliomicrobium gestii]MBM7866102.1 Ca2+:H+ antiporter [Heliomicrobium gestii]MZP42571.1 cation transporter [Heliomicrobium gestii]
MTYLRYLLLALPLMVYFRWSDPESGWAFLTAALSILPLAGYMGHATEELAEHVGPKLGGFLNATFGNATELIIALFALKAGHLEVVKASLIGSIIGNILLVLGLSVLVGGLMHGVQRFNTETAKINATTLLLAIIAMLVPSLFMHYHSAVDGAPVKLSVGVAVILLLVYGAVLYYGFRQTGAGADASHSRKSGLPADPLGIAAETSGMIAATTGLPSEYAPALSTPEVAGKGDNPPADSHGAGWSKGKALSVLVVSTVAVALASEVLVGSLEHTVATLGWPEAFIGIILIPIIGNAAEHSSAVMMAAKNQIEVATEIAIGSSIQIALFVAPLLVLAGLIFGQPMTMVFNEFELVAIVLAVWIAKSISKDGETNWLEGLMLLATYGIVATGFAFA